MKLKGTSIYVSILMILCTVILSGCDSKLRRYEEKEVSDRSIQQLNSEVNTIKDGLPFAIKRVNLWQEGLELDYINFGYTIENEKISEEGVISYSFFRENISGDICASARVDIDTKSNCIISFEGDYGTAKQLLGGSGGLDVESCNIDIKEALDIAKKEIGEDRILRHEKPNLILRCWDHLWQVAELSNEELPFDDYRVDINPTTGETLEVSGKLYDCIID